jgi:hypothetical protein
MVGVLDASLEAKIRIIRRVGHNHYWDGGNPLVDGHL